MNNTKNNSKNTNKVKVYTNNKNNTKLTNSELNDVIVLRKGAYMDLESESVGDNAKLGIIYLIKTM